MLKAGKAVSLVFVGSSIFAFAGMAAAQGGYAGISAGQAEVSDFCDDVIIECDDSALTGRIYAGGFFDKYLAFEGGYRFVDDTTIEDNTGSINVGYHMFDGSLLVFTPELGPVRLFAKLGAQFWRQDLSVSINGLGSASEEESGVSLRTGAGATIDITDSFGLRLEWDYLQDIGDDSSGIQNLKSDVHVFSAGPEFRF
ncbi:OmpA-like transmembrane domain-containing protein [Marinobacter sp. es.042]|uniref:outer membrane beta-barrel protein n=1 Tax=Marinobacter sp. es.042 TaxID=1761794 RepID=UPI000B50C8E9|nr:outer membrane beta-barrel protein [Marinobacter sp. es.042]SNB58296.1 OmpA-like transmembrane domain-containing protein [Marinobacter sp. es.042]